MSFNTALSGLSAASADLRITGNNIANASTTGFKASRAEFADVYASSLLGSGSSRIGSGVKLANVAQRFDQGTISFTNNNLDLAIDGNGFFVLNDNGASTYTRSGAFALDDEGFLVSNSNARVQGFTANESGTLSGIIGDLQVNTSNLEPKQTALLEAVVNLDARSLVLSQSGSNIDTTGGAIGVAQVGTAASSSTVLGTSGPPTPFDFSINQASSLTAANSIAPFDFGIDQASAVTANGPVTGFDFSLNTASGLTGSAAPAFFNFADKASAISGANASAAYDFSGANSATFDVSIVGSSANGSRTVTLNTNIGSVGDLVTAVNAQLGGIGVVAESNPADPSRIRFVASVPGTAATLSVDNFTASGATTTADVQSVLSGIADGTDSVRSSFDVTVAGSSGDGTVNITLTSNITSISSLLTDLNDQLAASGLALVAREDTNNPGRVQIASTDTGVASTVSVSNIASSDAGVSVANVRDLIRLSDGDSSAAATGGAVGVTGSLTQSSFDIAISGGSGAGGNASLTINLDQNYANGSIANLIVDINSQLDAVASPGIDVRAEEDPNNPGRIRFAATASGEQSVVTVDNFVGSTVLGDVQAGVADVSNLLGGIADGATDNAGTNTNASFQISLAGSDTPSENQVVTINLNRNIATLQDLINDIRDDLSGSGVGMDVREDPSNPGRIQFFSLGSGEQSTISIDPNDNVTLGDGVTNSIVQAALGGIALGQGGTGGATNIAPDPFGNSDAVGLVGAISSASFDVTLSGSAQTNGTATVVLDRNVATVDDLIADIRNELLQSGIGIDVRVDPADPARLQFFSSITGENSTIVIGNLDSSNAGVGLGDINGALNLATGISQPGVASVSNGYVAQSIDVIAPDGDLVNVETKAGDSAAAIAARFTNASVPGVSATAETVATLPVTGFLNTSGTLAMSINGVEVQGNSLNALAAAINGATGLGTVSAELAGNGDLVVTDQVGNDLVFNVVAGDLTDSVSVIGPNGTAVQISNGTQAAAAVGGNVNLTLQEGVALSNANPAVSNIFGVLSADAFEPFELNTFDPGNQDTYNHATSQTIFDSLGNPHVMSLFFVKEPFDATDPLTRENQWSIYAQIDGKDVGDPDPNLPPPQNVEPTAAKFTAQFTPDGLLDPAGTDTILISNWQPLDALGQPNGSLGPRNVLAGGTLPLPEPPLSSNFEVRLGDTTQFGSSFAVSELSQDGYTTGELSGIAIDGEGVLSARFTNGENQVLGQVAIAAFTNPQGLAAIGDTSWIQTGDSGEATVGAPGSGSLGAVTSGALEDSNVELSEQLVQLIIAQRNFQANARTISTSDEITQTIINL